MFRIRSKTNTKKQFHADKLRLIYNRSQDKSTQQGKKYYACLTDQNCSEFLWAKILQRQMDIQSTAIAFQTDSNIKIDAKQKMRWRQTFLLKKEIIGCISRKQLKELQQKLIQLQEKSNNESSIAWLMSEFCQIRRQILDKNCAYQKQMIRHIKTKILGKIEKNYIEHNNFIFVRILYILVLHIIRIEGVLLSNEDIQLINTTLNQKKRFLSVFGIQSFRNNLQSLLLVTFQFYRIIYRLKTNEDMVISYYKQVKAYISIFKEKLDGFQEFEAQVHIEKKLQSFVPISFYLNIYQDYEKRRALSFENTLKEIENIHEKNSKKISGLSLSSLNRQKPRLKKGSPETQTSEEEKQDTLSTEQQSERQIDTIINKELINFFEKYGSKQIARVCFSFDFVVPENQRILIGKFRIVVDEVRDSFYIDIVIDDGITYQGLFRSKPISVGQSKNVYNFSKRVWKIVKQKFYTDKSEFIPSLFSFESPPLQFMPEQYKFSSQLPILIVIHVIVIHYLKKNEASDKITGRIYAFPSQKMPTQKSLIKEKSFEQSIFTKRHGFISFDKKLKRDSVKQNKIMGFLNEKNHNFFNVSLTNRHFQIQERYCDPSNQNTQKFIKICKKLTSYFVGRSNKLKIKHIQYLLEILQGGYNQDEMKQWLQCLDRIMNTKYIQFKVEKQFQMISSNNYLEVKENEIKVSRMKNRKYISKHSKIKNIIKVNNKYETFDVSRQQSGIHLKNYKQNIIDHHKSGSPYLILIYQKFRLYSQYYWYDPTNSILYNQQPIANIPTKSQCIKLQHLQTKIIKTVKDRYYMSINIFKHRESKAIIYEVYNIGTGQRLFHMSKTVEDTLIIQKGESEEINGSMGKSKWILNQKYTLQRILDDNRSGNQICDAQTYYKKKTQIQAPLPQLPIDN